MKKEQKIIELRRAAKLKVSELETRIAIARSDAAGERSRLMWVRAAELDGLSANSTERYDVLALYRAKLADVNRQYESNVAQYRLKIQQIKSKCEQQCAAADDDPESETETDTEKDSDKTVKCFQPQQQTVYVDGSEHSARIVARRLINKMPHIPAGGFLFVHIIRKIDGDFFVGVTESGESVDKHIDINFSKGTHTAESEAEFVEEAREMFTTDEEKNNSNSHVAEPLSRALDAVFGGNPIKQIENIISDTVKDGKEGGDNE